MKEKIEMMLEYLTKLTKDESDFISHVLAWESDDVIAFRLARKMFEYDQE